MVALSQAVQPMFQRLCAPAPPDAPKRRHCPVNLTQAGFSQRSHWAIRGRIRGARLEGRTYNP